MRKGDGAMTEKTSRKSWRRLRKALETELRISAKMLYMFGDRAAPQVIRMEKSGDGYRVFESRDEVERNVVILSLATIEDVFGDRWAGRRKVQPLGTGRAATREISFAISDRLDDLARKWMRERGDEVLADAKRRLADLSPSEEFAVKSR